MAHAKQRRMTNLARCSVATVAVVAVVVLVAGAAQAATSGASVHSPMGGNGHSISFDGRVFVAAEGDGWNLFVLRPELVGSDDSGFPVVDGAFTSPVNIQ